MIPDFTLLSLDFRVKTFYNIRESKGNGTHCVESSLKQSMHVGAVYNPKLLSILYHTF